MKPCIGPAKTYRQLSRKEQIVLTRIKIGHTRLTNSFMLTGTRQPRCDLCNVRLTMKHILLRCSSRQKYAITSESLNNLEIDAKVVTKLLKCIQEIICVYVCMCICICICLYIPLYFANFIWASK